jgi:hypothetical protein
VKMQTSAALQGQTKIKAGPPSSFSDTQAIICNS